MSNKVYFYVWYNPVCKAYRIALFRLISRNDAIYLVGGGIALYTICMVLKNDGINTLTIFGTICLLDCKISVSGSALPTVN